MHYYTLKCVFVLHCYFSARTDVFDSDLISKNLYCWTFTKFLQIWHHLITDRGCSKNIDFSMVQYWKWRLKGLIILFHKLTIRAGEYIINHSSNFKSYNKYSFYKSSALVKHSSVTIYKKLTRLIIYKNKLRLVVI